ncbi:hypothetical protein [Sphingobium sp.]|uniref:hypothetical protein n=1 Tax=Sphingobium sp. TaxID=1912891 RepID=UPI0028BE9AAB|nr:hypothetical protein [Sphingobium sp.]
MTPFHVPRLAVIDTCARPEAHVAFEVRFHDIVFRTVKRPLTVLLARVPMRLYSEDLHLIFHTRESGAAAWKQQGHDIIHAILKQDRDMAWFEGMRRGDYVMRQLDMMRSGDRAPEAKP